MSDSIKDFSFTLMQTIIYSKALKLLGFINRVSAEFKLIILFKILFCSIVRPVLEYGSVIWNSLTNTASNMVERVQRKFLRHVYSKLYNKLHISYHSHDYSPVQRIIS